LASLFDTRPHDAVALRQPARADPIRHVERLRKPSNRLDGTNSNYLCLCRQFFNYAAKRVETPGT